MKRLLSISILFLAITVSAQVRTYQDNETATFIIGLDSYFYGESGSLGFNVGGIDVSVSVQDGAVSINGTALEEAEAETIIGIHDFTGDRQAELVVARRTDEMLYATVYQLMADGWRVIGRVGAADEGAREIRVFRQALTIRNKRTDAFYTWTFHAPEFDFKSSDGSEDPTPSL